MIIKTVDDQTMKLASRRGDLEREAALAYARSFNEDQLNQIAAFYQSEAGLKLSVQWPDRHTRTDQGRTDLAERHRP